jgi:hypothetical protein
MEVSLTSKKYDVTDIYAFTELAYEQGWTDGIPVLPPTEEKVIEAIEYIKRDPKDVIGVIPPGEGVATVEKIVINCVMAGCKPEYVPVVITAVEAMVDEQFELMRVQCTTGGPAPLAILSGPVVKQLGFNYGEGAFTGTGNRANSCIGRAIRLILWNIGLGKPGQLSHATFGHVGRYAYLIAERPRDDGNPWEEFHVSEAGLKSEDSAISMFPAGTHDQITTGVGAQTLENNIYVIADALCHLGRFQNASQKLFVMNPQAANVFADAGWYKEKFRNEVLTLSKRPVKDIKRTGGVSITAKYYWKKIVDPDDDDALVPAMMGPHHLPILVSGGWAPPVSQCCVITSMHGEMVTKKIAWSWD